MADRKIDYDERIIAMSFLIGSLRGLLLELKPHLTPEMLDTLKQIDKEICFLYCPSDFYNEVKKS
jgi:hypothetical protein